MQVKMVKQKNKAKTQKKDYSTYFFRIAICAAIGILLAAVIYLEISKIETEKALPDSITFLYSDNCQVCPDVEKEAKDITKQVGLKFYRLKYDEREMTPGIMFVYNNTVLVTPYTGSQSFKQQICGFTGIKKACLMAGEAW